MQVQSHEYVRRVMAIHTLRVNVKSLAAEAKIIRKEERRCGPQYRGWLHCHRTGKLREEARHAQLAIGFIRGRKYKEIERSAETMPSAIRIAAKLRIHMGDLAEYGQKAIEKWLSDAEQ